MCATFTDDDVGKPVERTDGKVIGTVASLESEGAYVEPAPDVVDQIKARFDWGEIGGPFILDESDVQAISETRVHLTEGFSRADSATPAATESAARSDAGTDDGTGSASESTTPRTDSTGDSSGIGPFETRFQIGAAVVSAIGFLVAVLFGWTGYQGSTLPVAGTELSIVSGAVGFMLLSFFSVVALVAAIYMDPGLDH
ncbi:hypothetical protein [Natronorubrum sp. FCH18a]|uniref:hypothetical protein n=1 Tax=Natronorubrum sp. FCH18a TaxID=3447018 RepID=UPI003F5151E8